jgi:DtxR family Mn-dependent transcriptional regulator
LFQAEFNRIVEVCQVTNQSPEMLELLQHKNISIGSRLEVKKHFEFDNSLELKINRSVETITGQLAKNIYVTYEFQTK